MPEEVSIYIPYYTGDNGQRPLPGNISPAACYYIWPNGRPGNNFVRGVPLRLQVMMTVHGPHNLRVPFRLTAWWLAFGASGTIKTLFSEQMGTLWPRDEWWTTVEGTIPETAPRHVCLLLHVTSPLDPGGAAEAPGSDHHWAQLNLADVSIGADRRFKAQFTVGNRFPEDASFDVRVEPVEGERRDALVELIGRNLAARPELVYTLRDDVSGASAASDPSGVALIEDVKLHAGETRTLEIDGTVSGNLENADSFALSIRQFRTGHDDNSGAAEIILSLEPEAG